MHRRSSNVQWEFKEINRSSYWSWLPQLGQIPKRISHTVSVLFLCFWHCINISLTLKCTLNRQRWYELELVYLRTGFIDWIFVLVIKFYFTWNQLVGCILDSHASGCEECGLLVVILYTSWLGHCLLNTFHDEHENSFIKALALLDDWFLFQPLLEPYRIITKMGSLAQLMSSLLLVDHCNVFLSAQHLNPW
jgi:hypothetical protein